MENCGNYYELRDAEAGTERPREEVVFRGVEASPRTLRACSACAGDYEDPDRTAWAADGGDDTSQEEEQPAAAEGEFPVKKG